jgi:hypothetical protein
MEQTFVARICFSISFFAASLVAGAGAGAGAGVVDFLPDARATLRILFFSFLATRSFLAFSAFSNWSS